MDWEWEWEWERGTGGELETPLRDLEPWYIMNWMTRFEEA